MRLVSIRHQPVSGIPLFCSHSPERSNDAVSIRHQPVSGIPPPVVHFTPVVDDSFASGISLCLAFHQSPTVDLGQNQVFPSGISLCLAFHRRHNR